MQTNFIQKLRTRLQNELPGRTAQVRMATATRLLDPKYPDKVRQAGTLLLFYQKGKDWYFPLIQRPSNNPKDRHGGQISFPGGKKEKLDVDLTATALREAQEEIGVKAEDIEVVGQLSDLYVPVSNFMIHPTVGYLSYIPIFKRQVTEVEEVIEIRVKDLLEEANIKRKDLDLPQGFRLKNVPYFDIDNRMIWGATSMILSECVSILKDN